MAISQTSVWRRERLRRLPAGTAVARWAGLVGPALFTATYMAQEVLRRGEYDPVSEPVSALEAGPSGWVQQVNFVVFGLLTMAFAVGLHRSVRPTARGIVGPALLFVSGVGLELAAILPLREDSHGITYDPGGHFVAGLMFFGASAGGLVALSRRLRRDPHWRGLATYVLAAGIASIAGFVLVGALAIPDDAPLHDYAGLCQRALILVVLFPCRVLLAWRIGRAADGGQSSGGSRRA